MFRKIYFINKTCAKTCANAKAPSQNSLSKFGSGRERTWSVIMEDIVVQKIKEIDSEVAELFRSKFSVNNNIC